MNGVYAISDLHVGFPENRAFVESLRPESPGDWLIVAGDVAEHVSDVEWTLRTLSESYGTVIWTPGNHELWTVKDDPVRLRGEARYRRLVDMCRGLGVLTPEDPYPVWDGEGGPVTIAPLFILYDYTFRPDGASTKEEALAIAHESGVVCTDEVFLHPDPHPTPRRLVPTPASPTPRNASPRSSRGRGPSWSTTGRSSANPPASCGTRSSRSGAAPSAPPTGTAGSARCPSCTGTCTSPHDLDRGRPAHRGVGRLPPRVAQARRRAPRPPPHPARPGDGLTGRARPAPPGRSRPPPA